MVAFTLLLQFLTASVAAAYSNPGTCSGVCNVHDPAVIKRTSDGKYFRFSTGAGMAIATASSMAGPWTSAGTVLPKGSKVTTSGNTGTDAWAPDVIQIGSTYYLYYAISSFGTQISTLGVATSTDLMTWTDKGSTGISSKTGDNYNAIDANFITISGKDYMNFGSFWGDIYQVSMSSATKVTSGAVAKQVSFTSVSPQAREGAFMFYNSNTKYYYLLWSEGSCCAFDTSRPAKGKEYKIMMCRSKTGTSGFVDKSGVSCNANGGTALLETHDNVYGPGGQGVIGDSTSGFVLYYHYVDITIGYADGQKLFGYNTLKWSSGWPSV